ncbi:MAG: carboxypeptidase-like regulatory domain-containing protein [Terracidiphilus sp.]
MKEIKKQVFRIANRPLALWCAFTVLLLIFGGATAFAQLDTGAIAGTVLDPSNKVVEGARVEILETTTGTAYSTASSSSGYYVFPSVRTGIYDITVTSSGFKTAILHGVVVAVGVNTSEDITVEIGATTETINVIAGVQALEADTAEVDTSIQPEQVENLPLAVGGTLRSLETLVYLAPGVVGMGQASSTDSLKMNGGQEEGTDFLIDGITTNRQQNGSASFGIISPSVDAVNEFHVSLSGLPTQLGRTTGGITNYNTKGGTNDYHGSIYDFFKNSGFDANSWFYNGYIAEQGNTAAAKAAFKRPYDTKNDYGINLGGPVRIPGFYKGTDKTFFFFNWEQLRFNYGGAITSELPTPAELGSDGQYFDFSSTLGAAIPNTNNACGQPFSLQYGEIFDPAYEYVPFNGSPCRYVAFGQTYNAGTFITSGAPTNKIPITRASTIAQNITNKYLMPLANQEVSGSSAYNYIYRGAGTEGVINQTVYSIRLDQNIGARNKVWGFWSSRENTDTGGNSNFAPPIQTCCGTIDQLGKIFRAGWDWIATPTLVNSLTIGGNRSNNINLSKASKMGTNWDSQLGLNSGASSDDFPVIQLFGPAFGGIGQQEHSTDTDNVLALNDILHWQYGAHSFKVGGEAQYHQYSWVASIGGTCSGNAGCIQDWDNQTASDWNYWGQDGNALAAFLIGETGDMNDLVDLNKPRWITHYGAVFAQDDWKVQPNLTINLGLRWSFETPRREAHGDTAIWNPTLADAAASGIPGALVFAGKGAGRNGSENETWGSVYKKNFEPRVGFAWEPDFLSHKDVIRGSAGIYYGPLVEADFGQGTVQGFTLQGNNYTAGDPLSGCPLDSKSTPAQCTDNHGNPLPVGLPQLSTSFDLNPNQLDGSNIAADYVDKSNGRPGMVETWTLEVQHQIRPNLFANVGYLGMHSTRLHAMLNFMNDMPDKYMNLGDWLNWWAFYPGPKTGPAAALPYANFSCFGAPTASTVVPGCTWPINEPTSQALRPFPQVGYINMDSYLQNLGQSTYNALEAKLEQRFHNGLNILVSYTFSKTLTDADVIQPYWSTLQNGGAVQDPENLKGEKAVSSEDVPNNFVVSYIYELPVGQGKHFLGNAPRPISEVISHWSVSGVQHYLSGQPISIFGATGIPGKNSSVRFNRVPGQPVKNSAYKNPLNFNNASNLTACETGYFNCNAFYDPNLFANRDPSGVGASGEGNPWRFGTMPRNSSDIRGPGYSDEDFGISKFFSIHENINANFRAEMFDAFNRHIFTRPNSDLNVSNVSVGQIGGLQLGPRNVQFQLRINY